MCHRCSLASLVASQQLIRVPSGVILAAEEAVHTITGRATVYVPLSKDNPEERIEWRRSLASIESGLESVINAVPNASFMIQHGKRLMKRHYVRAFENLKEAFPLPPGPNVPMSPRQKRGLFNFMGDIASSLFGTPSASDLEALQSAQAALAETVDTVVDTQKAIIGVVNTLNENQQKVAGAVRRVTRQVNTLTDQLTQTTQETSQRFLMDEVISELVSFRLELTRYVAWSDRMLSIRAACESDSQSELVVPSTLLSKIIQQGEVRNYYQYLHTDKLMEVNKTLYCVVNVPLFRSTVDRLYVIETYPVCNGNCHRIYHHDRLVLDPLSETIYFPEECVGYSPLACRPGVEFPAAT